MNVYKVQKLPHKFCSSFPHPSQWQVSRQLIALINNIHGPQVVLTAMITS